MSQVVSKFAIHIDQVDGFQLRTRFDKDRYADLLMDEPPPLGNDVAPNPARVLAAAIGDCLSASLVFCMKRAGVALEGLSTDVEVELVRNEERRLRIGSIDVAIHPRLADRGAELGRCLETFEDFCVVTQSVRQGIDVRVHVDAVGPLAATAAAD